MKLFLLTKKVPIFLHKKNSASKQMLIDGISVRERGGR